MGKIIVKKMEIMSPALKAPLAGKRNRQVTENPRQVSQAQLTDINSQETRNNNCSVAYTFRTEKEIKQRLKVLRRTQKEYHDLLGYFGSIWKTLNLFGRDSDDLPSNVLTFFEVLNEYTATQIIFGIRMHLRLKNGVPEPHDVLKAIEEIKKMKKEKEDNIFDTKFEQINVVGDAWRGVRKRFFDTQGGGCFKHWIKNIQYLRTESSPQANRSVIILQAPTRFTRQYVLDRYYQILLKLWQEQDSNIKMLEIELHPEVR